MNSVTVNTALERIDVSKLSQHVEESLERIRNHPFILEAGWKALSQEKTLRWVYCAGRESRTFPRILENMLSYCEDEIVRAILTENLDDEYGNGNPEQAHFRHYVHLLEKLGVGRQGFDAYRERAGIRLALDLAISISSRGNLPQALGYMLVNEGMTPITYSAVKEGVLQHFPATRTAFFDMHIEVDDHHVNELYRACSALPTSALPDLLYGVQIGERGMAVLLDEVQGLFDASEASDVDQNPQRALA